ncbi:MAG: CHAT domain-containing protein, partial [Longimicrobiales bacterium]
ALADEAIPVASKIGKEEVLAWGLRARAGDLMGLNRTAEAKTDLVNALEWAGKMRKGRMHDRVQADVSLTMAELELGTDPQAAMRILSDVVDTYRRLEMGWTLSSALHTAAMAAQASDSTAAARRYLDQAIQHIEQQRASFTTIESRAMLYETVEKVFDAVIALELDARPELAFAYLERSRAAARSIGEPTPQPAAQHLDRVRAAVPPGMVLLEYALLPERVAVWAISRQDSTLLPIPVSRDSIAVLVQLFRRESNLTDAESGRASAALFDALVRPVLPRLGGIAKLAVVPDRELHSVPFAALRDRETNQFLIESFEVHTLPSASFLVEAAGRKASSRRALQTLVVGNPALDSAAGLDPLKGASAEATAIAGLYERHELLLEQAAQRKRVLELLPGQTVFHFAGHAVFNSEQPERSYLALSPDQPNESGMLLAREIGNLRLSNLQMVILAACSTLNPRTTRVGNVAGLAHSFLQAGVPSVISSIWDVSDATTGQLLLDFHRRFAVSRDAAAALRAAQINALKSTEPERRAIQNWAAFIYTGI